MTIFYIHDQVYDTITEEIANLQHQIKRCEDQKRWYVSNQQSNIDSINRKLFEKETLIKMSTICLFVSVDQEEKSLMNKWIYDSKDEIKKLQEEKQKCETNIENPKPFYQQTDREIKSIYDKISKAFDIYNKEQEEKQKREEANKLIQRVRNRDSHFNKIAYADLLKKIKEEPNNIMLQSRKKRFEELIKAGKI